MGRLTGAGIATSAQVNWLQIFSSAFSCSAWGRPGCMSNAQTTLVNHISSFHKSLLAIKLHRLYFRLHFPLRLYLPFPALKILATNCQIQILFGSGIICSGAKGRAERSLKILLRLMASNCSRVFKALFFGSASCVQEKGATALVRVWEGGFDSSKRWPCACCHQYRLCLFCPYVFSWCSSSCSSACLTGACEARPKSCIAVKNCTSLSKGCLLASRFTSCFAPAPADLTRNMPFSALVAALQKWQSCWMGLHNF